MSLQNKIARKNESKNKRNTIHNAKLEESKLSDSISDEENDRQEDFIPLDSKSKSQYSLKRPSEMKSAWEDPDDKDVEMDLSKIARLRKLRKTKEETVITGEEYQERLQEYYSKAIKTSHFYDWANKPVEKTNATQESYLDSILKTNASVTESSRAINLAPETLKISKIAMNPIENKHNCVIQDIDFHKDNQTLLSTGLDKTIKIFSLSRVFENNSYELRPLKTLYAKNLPILTAKFNSYTNEIIATGLKKYILGFDLTKETFDKSDPSFITSRLDGKVKSFSLSPNEETIALYGHNQYLMMVSARTKQLLYELKLNSECSACSFSSDNKYLFTSTEDGDVYQWDLGMRKVLDVFHDVGSSKTTCIDMSNDGNYLATGNSAGIVNIYNFNKMTRTVDQKIIKEVDNLTTNINNVKFNSTGEILALTSNKKRNAIRLMHVPTQTVFSNWPNLRTKISLINKICFSQNSQYMALGNDLGSISVYNLEHYNL